MGYKFVLADRLLNLKKNHSVVVNVHRWTLGQIIEVTQFCLFQRLFALPSVYHLISTWTWRTVFLQQLFNVFVWLLSLQSFRLRDQRIFHESVIFSRTRTVCVHIRFHHLFRLQRMMRRKFILFLLFGYSCRHHIRPRTWGFVTLELVGIDESWFFTDQFGLALLFRPWHHQTILIGRRRILFFR